MVVYAVFLTYYDGCDAIDSLLNLYSTAELAEAAKFELELTHGDVCTTYWTHEITVIED